MLEHIIYAMEDQQQDYAYDFELGVVPISRASKDAIALPTWTAHDGCTLIASFLKQLDSLDYQPFAQVFAQNNGVFKRFKQALAQVPWQKLRYERYKHQYFMRVIEAWMAEHPRFEQDPLELYADDYFDEAACAEELLLGDCELRQHDDTAALSFELVCAASPCASFSYNRGSQILKVEAQEDFAQSGLVVYALRKVLTQLKDYPILGIDGIPYDEHVVELLEASGWRTQHISCIPTDSGIEHKEREL